MSKFPTHCPSCDALMQVTECSCVACTTKVQGQFTLPKLLQLLPEEQDFILQFVLYSGSLKEMAQKMGISYPTVRNRLDDLIHKLNQTT
jgi:hypothetical protein